MASPISFIKEVREELGKVVWPTREQVVRSTTIVILISLIAGIFLGGIDFIFTKLMETVIK
ncbi:MAG: hypothetical protein ACD_50C00175G0012 [uncultured bacterium]|nr:MAG: hypothetical protein ACD_50C00175G0012 [uncultured bacterium]OGH13593.1 MAG: preprotein translocase subunit SecE [Candidatus Levybacteria bacterium RIFCSPHIGHO2_01_FULL_38_26]